MNWYDILTDDMIIDAAMEDKREDLRFNYALNLLVNYMEASLSPVEKEKWDKRIDMLCQNSFKCNCNKA